MKKMEIVIEKIKKIIEEMYVKELLGVSLYDSIPEDVMDGINELRTAALEYEMGALKNDPDYGIQHKKVGQILDRLKNRLLQEKNWRKPPYLLDFF